MYKVSSTIKNTLNCKFINVRNTGWFLRNGFLLILMISVVSCADFLDVNTNPNSPVSENLPLSAKFPAALVSTVNQENGQINLIGAFWGGYWGTNNEGTNQFFDLKTYNGPGLRSQREGIPVWEHGYNNILYFRLIQDEAEASGEVFYAGTSKIMQGWIFLRLVDFYNNIPFDQAAQGNVYLQPEYEPGEQVYKKSIDLISEGIDDVKSATTNPTIVAADLMFGGDKNLWIRFGNTVKLRALIRQSEKGNNAYIASELGKIQSEGTGFLGIGQHADINPGYLNTSGKMNPFWATFYRDVQGNTTANYQIIRPTIYLLEQYALREDPRIETLYMDREDKYNGVIFGNPDAGDPEFAMENTSAFKGPVENAGNPTGIMHSYNQSAILMSSFESLFLQAETVQRGWLPGNAGELYRMAIGESFLYVKASLDLLDTYVDHELVNYDAASDKIARIIEQKWLALNSISSMEAWSDFRRLGIPEFPATAATGITGRPYRLMYPETERGTNNENASAQGSDLVTQDKIWWMP